MKLLTLKLVIAAVAGLLLLPSAASLAMRRRLQPVQSKSNLDPSVVKSNVKECTKFLDACPEPFHVVKYVTAQLQEAGFIALDEASLWKKNQLVRRGGKYYFTRNASSVVAFTVGEKYVPGNGFKVFGAHTDSPNLRLKPKTKKSGSGCIQLNVECYGGGLWHTWFDRDLSLAGRVILKPASGSDTFRTQLVKIDRPVLRIPNLCIHLQSGSEREAFKVNKQNHLMPILCSEVKKTLDSQSASTEDNTISEESSVDSDEVMKEGANEGGDDSSVDVAFDDVWRASQQPELLDLLAQEMGCDVEDILDFEFSLYDTQGASISGYREEFLCSSRLDNLASCFAGVEALLAHANNNIATDEDVSIVALFDHEEVGSQSFSGAGSTLIGDSVERISLALTGEEENSEVHKAARSRSFILSVDMAHAVHPNYASKHDKALCPTMNAGIVIKTNNNQRYTTNGVTGFFVRELARRAGVPIQEFAVRNDCPCGSTIGPMLSTNTGIRAVDLGMPQLSMHSIREMMGCEDLTHGTKLFEAFFKDFRAVESALKIDTLQ